MDATAGLYRDPDAPAADAVLDDAAAALVRRHADAILRLREGIQSIQDRIAAEYATARSEGLDRRALAELVRRLQSDADDLREQRAIVLAYEDAYHTAGVRAALRAGSRADA